MEKGARAGAFKRILTIALMSMAILGLVSMALSVLNAFINPKHFIWTTMFGLAFWVIFFFNVLILTLLLLIRSKWAWISALAFLIAIPGLCRSISLSFPSKADHSLKVMSYNVHNFKHVDGKTQPEDFANEVVALVREKAPDILCCQEFSGFKKGETRTKCIKMFADSAGFPYYYYNMKKNYGGNVLFSKYPIEKVSEESGFGQENTYGIMVSVDAGEHGKFYVANVHLLSYMITDNEIDILMNSSDRQDEFDDAGKSVLHKLSYAFQKRSEQLKEVLEGMPRTECPVLVCGDFNEPPLSYNYNQMRRAGFVDTFIKAGNGIKPTYAGKLPLLRIDYIWANDKVKPLDFDRYRYKASDHYPIMLEFALNQ